MLATTSDGLDALFRQEVDDVLEGTPPSDVDRLWKETEVYSYMTEAADATARAVLGRYKTIQIPLEADKAVYPLPMYVFDIRSARTLTYGQSLVEHNIDEYAGYKVWDYGMPLVGSTGIFTATGVPIQYMRDYDARAIRLIPIPAAADTLELQCVIGVATPMAPGMPLPFMEIPDQRLMLIKMKALAYAKNDSDMRNDKRAAAYEAEFVARAKERNVEQRRIRRAPGCVRMEW